MCAARKIKLPGRWQEWGNDLFPLDHDRGTGHPRVWYQNQTTGHLNSSGILELPALIGNPRLSQ
jgi:hypothetical protein